MRTNCGGASIAAVAVNDVAVAEAEHASSCRSARIGSSSAAVADPTGPTMTPAPWSTSVATLSASGVSADSATLTDADRTTEHAAGGVDVVERQLEPALLADDERVEQPGVGGQQAEREDRIGGGRRGVGGIGSVAGRHARRHLRRCGR